MHTVALKKGGETKGGLRCDRVLGGGREPQWHRVLADHEPDAEEPGFGPGLAAEVEAEGGYFGGGAAGEGGCDGVEGLACAGGEEVWLGLEGGDVGAEDFHEGGGAAAEGGHGAAAFGAGGADDVAAVLAV